MLEAAIDAMIALGDPGGASIEFEPGVYKFARHVHIRSPTEDGWIRSLWLLGRETTFEWTSYPSGLVLERFDGNLIGGMTGIRLRRSPASDSGFGLHLIGITGFMVHDLSVEGFGTGIQLDAPRNGAVITRCAHNVLHLREVKDNLVGLSFRTGEDPDGDGGDPPYANNNLIRGGIWTGRVGEMSRHIVMRDAALSNVFEGCVFDGTAEYAVELRHSRYQGGSVMFRGCTFEGSRSGSLFRFHDKTPAPQYLPWQMVALSGGNFRGERLIEDVAGHKPDEGRPRFLTLGPNLDFREPTSARVWGIWTEGSVRKTPHNRLPSNNYER